MLEEAKYEITLKVNMSENQDVHSGVVEAFANLVDYVLVNDIKTGQISDGFQKVVVLCQSQPTSSKDSEDILREIEKELLSKEPLLLLINIVTRPRMHGFFAVRNSELKEGNAEFNVDLYFMRHVASDELYRRFLLDGRVHQVLMGYQEILGKRGQYKHSGMINATRENGEPMPPSKANPYNFVAMFLEENKGVRVSLDKGNVTGMILRRTETDEFAAKVLYREHSLMLSANVDAPFDREMDVILTELIKKEFLPIAHLISINYAQTVKGSFLSVERTLRVSYSIQSEVDEKATLAKVIENTIKPGGCFKFICFAAEKRWLPAIRMIPGTITGPEPTDVVYEVDLNFIRLLVHNGEFCQKVAGGSLIESRLRYSFVHDCPMPWVYSPDAIDETWTTSKNSFHDCATPYANVAKRFLTNTELRVACAENRIVRFTLKRDKSGKVDFNFDVRLLRPEEKTSTVQLTK